MLVVGVLRGREFVWSAASLVRAIQEAAQSGHLTLGLLGALYSDGVRLGGPLMDGLDAALLTTVGTFLLRGGHRTRPEAHGRQPWTQYPNAREK